MYHLTLSLFVFFFASIFCSSCKPSKTTEANPTRKELQESVTDEAKTADSVPKEVQRLHAEIPADAVARFQQTPCFGSCPVYVLTLFKGGRARFEGTNFVKPIGTYEAEWSQSDLLKMKELAAEIDFYELASIYDNSNVTDLPSSITTLSTFEGEGEYKTVINRYGGPEKLKQLERFFEELVKNTDWGTEVEGE